MAAEKITKDLINQRIAIASEVITSAISSSIIGEEFLAEIKEDYLERVFEKNLDFSIIINILSKSVDYVRKHRSSYLPSEFFINNGEVISESNDLESYENAFMRLMGMPDVLRLVDGNPDGDSLGEIAMCDYNGNLKAVTFSELMLEVIDERQRKPSQRLVKTDPETIFGSLSDDTMDLDSEDLETIGQVAGITPAIYATEGGSTIGDGSVGRFRASLSKINSNFMKFSYLLLPPVQDYRISKAVNEPSKIVPAPFDSSFKNINGQTSRPPLLESIIRIRLDKLSGTNIKEEAIIAENVLGPNANDEDFMDPDNYGLLEAIILKRLDASITAMARLCGKKIIAVKEALEKTGTKVTNPSFEGNSYPDAKIKTESIPDSTEQTTSGEEGESLNDKEMSRQINILRQQKTIEDSILTLLSTNLTMPQLTDIDDQKNTLRSSSVINSHLADSFIGILKTQSQHINNRLSELEKKTETGPSASPVSKFGSEIKTIIGVDIGVGVLDVLVYCLALFALDEDSLLGLLPPKSFEYLKKEYNSLLPTTATQQDLVISINNLTTLVLSGYKKFESEIA